MISKNEIRNRARAFATEWKDETSEDAEAKSFWDGFFEVFGVSRRRIGSFEYKVKKANGADGYIDVLWKGTLLCEHKSRGKDLEKAYTQAKDYLPGLADADLPRYIIVSDFEKIKLFDLETSSEEFFSLSELHKHIDSFGFISGYTTEDYKEEERASIYAAGLLADFHNEIVKTGYSGHDLEVFLVRVLFCLFADDTGIFDKNHFKGYIQKRLNSDGSDLGMHLSQIFYILNTPLGKRQTTLDEQLAQFPYINGGIFAETIAPVSLDVTAYLKLINCCKFDWSTISVSIFGSLFQGVMDAKERRALGAHYTSEQNIIKVIQPLFIDELYIEFDQVKNSKAKLRAFHDKLANLTFLDPACGCGNFLVVAYRELRRLEHKIIKIERKGDKKLSLYGAEEASKIQVNQFYGIEIEEFPSQVARLAMYLVDHQMNQELSAIVGGYYARIPLREPATIVHADALITDWENIVSKEKLSYILGNPPFVGAQIMSKEQKESLLKVFGNTKGVGNLDFVTAWYEKASHYIQNTKIKVAFVSTNSICQGEQVGLLWKNIQEKYGIIIHFAHQTFKWNNDAPGVAAVQCIIVGFATFDIPKKYLFEYADTTSEPKETEVKNINGYLISGINVFVEKRTKPICDVPSIMKGNYYAKSEGLIIEEKDLEYLVTNEPNVQKYIKLLIGADEFINNRKRYCLWLVDCPPSDLRKMPLVMERIERVQKDRLKSTDKGMQNLAPTRFRETNNPDTCLVIPVVSSEKRIYIPIGFIDKDTISTNGNLIVPNASLYHFGILTSIMHMTWVSYTCGRLESRYRYSKDIVYNNFPWPEDISDTLKVKVGSLALAVLDARAKFAGSSLADLYSPLTMPPELSKAHTDLDRAVDSAYGKKFENKEVRIEHLFELYKKYTK